MQWQLSADEIEALRRAGKHFGKQALEGDPVLMSRILGDLLPEEREIRKLWDEVMQQPGVAGMPLQRAILQKQLAGLTQGVNEYEAQKLLAVVSVLLEWENMQELTEGDQTESVQLAIVASVNMEEITKGFSNKSVPGMLVVRSDGVALYKHKTAGYIGAVVTGALTMGIGMRAMMKRTHTEETPSFFLPAAEIHSISRQYLPGLYDLMLVMNNGRRFRVNCTALNSEKNQVETAAVAIEGLIAKR